MRLLPQLLRCIIAAAVLSVPVMATAAPARAFMSQPDDQGSCYYLGDRVGGESTSTPVIVKDGLASSVDAETLCAGKEFSDDTATLAIMANGGPGFAHDGALVVSIGVLPGTVARLEFVVVGLDTENGGDSFARLDAPAHWSLTAEDIAAIIPETGELLVSSEATHGRELTAHGEVEIGGQIHIRDITILIYTEEGNPVAGAWTEVAQIGCDDGEEFKSEHSLKFLVFSPSGNFRVVLADDEFDTGVNPSNLYSGLYVVDPQAGTLTLMAMIHGEAPPGFDGTGSFSIDSDGSLVITGIWLEGSEMSESAPVCGIRFERTE